MIQHTQGTWKPGKVDGTVVALPQNAPEDKMTGHNDYEYYGGYVIAESIAKKGDINLISAAPDMLFALQVVVGKIQQNPNSFTKAEKLNIVEEAIKKATRSMK